MLLAGTSGIGKSTLATALIERFVKAGFQFCVLDPEGDYEELEDAVVIGDADQAPSEREIFDLLSKPSNNVVVNMLGAEDGRAARILCQAPAGARRGTRPHRAAALAGHRRGAPSAAGGARRRSSPCQRSCRRPS